MTNPYFDADDYNDISEENEMSAPRIMHIPLSLAGERLDSAIAKLMPEHSRSRLTQWIKDGHVTLNGAVVAGKTKVMGDEVLSVEPVETAENRAYLPEDLPLDIIYQDEHILVVNKPAGMVVHPASGNWSGTLLNALLFHFPDIAQVPRAGIVHRLDKDTSGLMVVAKTLAAQTNLVRQMQARTVKRLYRAVADGVVPFDGTINSNIGRDPHNRLKMACVKFGGKQAITHVRVLERFADHSYIECRLETGRTHQIRVHMREAKHPLAGDPVYGDPRHKMGEDVARAVKGLARQALHAFRLSLQHPATGETKTWTARIPDDMRALLAIMRGEAQELMLANLEEDDLDDDWDESDDEGVEVMYVRD